jgi:ABC-type dipeptide/oligopeptide/nickel transport system ATPase component
VRSLAPLVKTRGFGMTQEAKRLLMTSESSRAALLSAQLSVAYSGKQILRDVRMKIFRGEVLGLVGQSGSGKSTLAMAILGLLDRKRVQTGGVIEFEGRNLLHTSEGEFRSLRGRAISLVLQSPLSSLNPALRIRTQLKEAWRAHAAGSKAECEKTIRNSLANVSLPADDDFLRKYPSQMSVGQAQRVLIAMATLHRPALLIADEATSALDVITQSEILALFRRLNRSSGMAILYISHDLGSVAGICDSIAILHQGEIVECAATMQIFTNPRHAYTRQLMAALPRIPREQPEPTAMAAAGE